MSSEHSSHRDGTSSDDSSESETNQNDERAITIRIRHRRRHRSATQESSAERLATIVESDGNENEEMVMDGRDATSSSSHETSACQCGDSYDCRADEEFSSEHSVEEQHDHEDEHDTNDEDYLTPPCVRCWELGPFRCARAPSNCGCLAGMRAARAREDDDEDWEEHEHEHECERDESDEGEDSQVDRNAPWYVASVSDEQHERELEETLATWYPYSFPKRR